MKVIDDVDVIVIGGGAAGLFCAALAGKQGLRVVVIEHANKVGKKILMSGGGRCNFTNTGASPENYLSNNPHFCKSALARFTPWHFIEYVSRHGIAYHEKELGQLFCDDSSKQIVQMLLDECAQGNVSVLTHCSVLSVSQREDGAFDVKTNQGNFVTQKLVCATGGLSIPSMGASGFGYDLAKKMGHTVLPLRAGLVPLTLSGKPQEQFADLSGVAFEVEARCDAQSFRNAMLITHRGLSGPSILQISSYWKSSSKQSQKLFLNLLPSLGIEAMITDAQNSTPDAMLATVLGHHLPKRFAQRLCEVWVENKPIKQYQHKSLDALVELLGDFEINASGTEGYRTAEVTLGGIDTNEISSQTMVSKKVDGLYFIGEVVDVTGWLGGYNFQWAWASAHAAAMALAT